MVSRETRIGAVSIALALNAAYVASQVGAPDWAVPAIVLGVGVVAPLLVTDYLDRREAAGAE